MEKGMINTKCWVQSSGGAPQVLDAPSMGGFKDVWLWVQSYGAPTKGESEQLSGTEGSAVRGVLSVDFREISSTTYGEIRRTMRRSMFI